MQRSEPKMCQEVENGEWGQSVASNDPREIWTHKQQPNQDSQDEPEVKNRHQIKFKKIKIYFLKFKSCSLQIQVALVKH